MKNKISHFTGILLVLIMFSCQKNTDQEAGVNVVSTEEAIDSELKAEIDRSKNLKNESEITKIMVVDELVKSQSTNDMLVTFIGQPLIYTISKNRNTDIEILHQSFVNKLPIVITIETSNYYITKLDFASNTDIYDYEQSHKEILPDELLNDDLNDGHLESRSNDIVPNLSMAKKIFDEVNKMSVVYSNGTYAAAGLNVPGYNLGRIPYQYAQDGCYARAHAIRRVVENNFGYTSYKRFIITPNIAQMPLTVKATKWSNRGCCISWGYHVAVSLKVRLSNGKVEWYILDPSIFSEPVPAATWDNSMIGNPNTSCKNMSAYNNQYRRYTIASQYYTPSNMINNQQYFTVDHNNGHTFKTMNTYRLLKSCPR